jgi:glycosyltransferase involved in cell wall biosynthesis
VKITFVLPGANLSGGVRVVAIYADKLSQRGHRVTVVYPAPRDVPVGRKLKSWVRGRGWPATPDDGPSHLDQRRIERVVARPWRPIGDGDVPDADVVVATWWETAEWVARLSPAKGAKAYFLQHYETFAPQPAERVKATWKLPLHKIVIARWLETIARDDFGDSDVSLVPNAVDLDQFHAPPRGKQSTPTVGTMLSHTWVKGTDVAFAGFVRACATIPSLRLMVFGDQPPNQTLSLPPNAAYTLRPPQDRIRDLYASCDAWVMGSRSEGFGLPLLEAMACRTPIISTPTGAGPELADAGAGFLVRQEDPDDLAAAIVRIVRMPDDQWRALSARAHAIATAYTWDQAAKTFLAALERAITSSARR